MARNGRTGSIPVRSTTIPLGSYSERDFCIICRTLAQAESNFAAHGHKGCRYATKPKSNAEFWEAKIARNKHRDEVTAAHLEALGWTVIIVWECELRGKEKAEARIQTLAEEIRSAVELKKQKEDRRRLSRAAAKREREQMLERQDALEKEIKRMFPIPQKVKIASKEE